MATWESFKATTSAAPSLWSAAKENNVSDIRSLVERGVDIDERDYRGFSALMIATYAGNEQAVDALLAYGADPNSTDLAGNSVLMGAAFRGYVDIAQKLLAAGADPAHTNAAGLDARKLALNLERSAVVALFDRLMP